MSLWPEKRFRRSARWHAGASAICWINSILLLFCAACKYFAGGEIKKELSALGSLKLELPDLATRYGRYDEAMQQIDSLVKDLTTHFGRLAKPSNIRKCSEFECMFGC